MKKHVRTILTVLLSICILLSCISVGFAAAPASGNQETSHEAFRVGIDSETRGHWKGKYGSNAAILLGYNYSGEIKGNGETTFISHDQYNYIAKAENSTFTSMSYDIAGDLWCHQQSDDSILDKPEDALCSEKFFAGAFSGRGGGAHYNSRATFEFQMSSESYHVISIYGSSVATNTFFVVFEKDGKELLTDELPANTFKDGAYISYLVPGSFKMYMDKPQMDFGINAIFIDDAAACAIDSLTVAGGSEPRSARLSWNAASLDSNAQIIVDRRVTDGAWDTLATLSVEESQSGQYLDRALNAGTTYEYRLRTICGTSYSLATQAVSYTVPTYKATELTLDKALYTADSTADTVIVKATLKDSSSAVCAGQTVLLKAEWPHGTQTIPAAVTDENGVAEFSFQPDYLGQATLTADFEDNDTAHLNHSTAAAELFVGETNWNYAPVVYKVSEAVLPGDLVNINGYGFRNEDMTKLAVKYASHTTDTVAAEPPADAKDMEIVQMDARNGYYLVTELPANATAGLYDIWVTNGIGYAEPITLNAARPLFISEYEAWDGQTIEISGRNLLAGQFGSDAVTKVRLGNTEQKIVKNTPYSITFKVQAPLGTYNVEVSNDNGITWRGLVTDQTLTVVSKGNDPLNIGVAWMDHFAWENSFDVTAYGANGTDEEDDTAVFRDAIAAAKASESNGGVIYVPNGSYYVGELKIPANIVILGESTDGVLLYYNGTGGNMFESSEDGQTVGHQGFANFSIRLSDDNTRPDSFFWLGHAWGNEAYDVTLILKPN